MGIQSRKDFPDTAVKNVSVFVRDQVTSKMLEAAAAKTVPRLIGFIPVVGDLAYLAIDTGMDYMKEKQEAEQNLSDIKATMDAWGNSNYCEELSITAVVVSDGSANQQLILYPSPDTKNILGNINELIQLRIAVGRPLDLEGYSLTYPITREDVFYNSGSVSELLEYGMTESERSNVTNPRN